MFELKSRLAPPMQFLYTQPGSSSLSCTLLLLIESKSRLMTAAFTTARNNKKIDNTFMVKGKDDDNDIEDLERKEAMIFLKK